MAHAPFFYPLRLSKYKLFLTTFFFTPIHFLFNGIIPRTPHLWETDNSYKQDSKYLHLDKANYKCTGTGTWTVLFHIEI